MKTEKCEVHETILKLMKAPVSYGLPAFDEEFFKSRNELFPNSNRSVLGGCMIGEENYREVLVCEECRKVESDWNKANRPNKNQKIGDLRF